MNPTILTLPTIRAPFKKQPGFTSIIFIQMKPKTNAATHVTRVDFQPLAASEKIVADTETIVVDPSAGKHRLANSTVATFERITVACLELLPGFKMSYT